MIFQTKRYYAYMAIDNIVLRDVQDGDLPPGLPYVLTFPNYNTKEIASYMADETHQWTAERSGAVWTLCGFNNQNNAWTYVACGRKSAAVTATITSPVANDYVTKIVYTVDETNYVEKAELVVIDEFGVEGDPIAIENW